MTEKLAGPALWARQLVEHLNAGRKLIIQSAPIDTPRIRRGLIIPRLINPKGAAWNQRFVVLRQATREEFLEEMAPLGDNRKYPHVDGAAYWEVMAD